ncbi:hypothetical protein MUK42_04490 [Musa troglodytarum]|uniref:Uncharacterized protein n=1 Tax=Musa troglodytarum TaxID=320322 RepID=A0A9E7GCA7_9LILI|nr:hypothetical protein MUK42_04490 [Musa troglodytarum]
MRKVFFSNNDKYPLKHIFHIIKREVSYEPTIQCNTKSGQQQQLYQVHICISKQGNKFINHKVSIKRKYTSPEIVFPPVPNF